MDAVPVKNGGTSRKGEKRANSRSKEDMDRYAGPRQIENCKRRATRKAENVELLKEGLYKCVICFKVKPVADFPQHAPTSAKFSRFETCEKCLDDDKEKKRSSGVTQKKGDRNATRSMRWQRNAKAPLQDKDEYGGYRAECDSANPPKPQRYLSARHDMYTQRKRWQRTFLSSTMV